MNRLWARLWLGLIVFAVLTLGLLVGAAFVLDEVLPSGEQGFLVLGGVVGVGGTLSVLTALVLARLLAGPLSLVSRAARRVASGDLSARVPVTVRGAEGRGELSRLQLDFNAMAESLERLERERRVYAAATAHELRTPLTVLKGRLEGLRDGVLEATPDELALLLTQIGMLARLIEDLRTLSLAEVNRLDLDLGTVDLTRLASEVIAGCEIQAGTGGVHLSLVSPAEVFVKGDRTRLRQVITNLLDNALAFSPKESRVDVLVSRGTDNAVLVVRDAGPGVRPEALERIFDRFYQDGAAGPVPVGGSGLGLAIAKSLVRLHGGHIEARNHPEGGAEFRVILPHQEGA